MPLGRAAHLSHSRAAQPRQVRDQRREVSTRGSVPVIGRSPAGDRAGAGLCASSATSATVAMEAASPATGQPNGE
jgi:hypothetical protein